MPVIVIGYLLMNLLGFVMMGVDKKKARKRQRRISEKSLWMIALIGGALGGTFGMQFFRHKTKHRSFQIGFPVFAIAEAAIFVFFLKS